MKTIMKPILCLLILCSLSAKSFSQVNMQGCQNEWGTTTYVLNNTGTVNDAGTIRNTYETTPIDALQSCLGFGFGYCEMRIRWSISNVRWEVDLNDGGGSFFNIYFNTSASVPNPPNLSLGSWVENTAITGNSCTTGLTIMSGDVQNSIVLPVSWASFDARLIGETVEVEWATYQEQNSQSFEVERSQDATNYELLAIVPAQGKSDSLHRYFFADTDPLAGQSYYRIKQIDQDGQYTYSKVRSIIFENKKVLFSLLDERSLQIQYPFDAGAKVRLLDIKGTVHQKQLLYEAQSKIELDLSTLIGGVYIIEIQNGKERIFKKWIKY
ncbi:MAG: T9SS type A sorting domain-containing protein [Bacteroidia bacterium]